MSRVPGNLFNRDVGAPGPVLRAVRRMVIVAALFGIAGCSPSGPDMPAAFSVRAIEFPGGEGAGQPHFAPDPDGRPVVSWLEPEGESFVLRDAVFADGSWGSDRTVTRRDDFFINWADFPSVRPIGDDLWLAHWLARQPESFGAYDAVLSVSRDGGASWTDPVRLNDDTTETEHGFVETFAWDDSIGALWLDGRELANWSFDNPDALLGVSLRYAEIGRDGKIVARSIVDDLVCDCCQPSVAIADGGPVVAYRNRTPQEIRDVVVRRFDGTAWSEPVSVGEDRWHIEGCPVNGPAIAALGDLLAVAWFTGASGTSRVQLSRSDDGGDSFMPPVEIDSGGAYGQVGIVIDDDGGAIVSWWRRAEQGGIDLALRGVGRDGSLGDIHVIAHSDVAQPIDVPQIIRTGNGVLVAWTTFDDGGAVRTAYVEGVR